MKHGVASLSFCQFLLFNALPHDIPRGEIPRGETPQIPLHLMSVDPLPPVEHPPPWHHQDEEKDVKEHLEDPTAQDAFGNEEHAEVKYKVLSWWYVPYRPRGMIASSIPEPIS